MSHSPVTKSVCRFIVAIGVTLVLIMGIGVALVLIMGRAIPASAMSTQATVGVPRCQLFSDLSSNRVQANPGSGPHIGGPMPGVGPYNPDNPMYSRPIQSPGAKYRQDSDVPISQMPENKGPTLPGPMPDPGPGMRPVQSPVYSSSPVLVQRPVSIGQLPVSISQLPISNRPIQSPVYSGHGLNPGAISGQGEGTGEGFNANDLAHPIISEGLGPIAWVLPGGSISASIKAGREAATLTDALGGAAKVGIDSIVQSASEGIIEKAGEAIQPTGPSEVSPSDVVNQSSPSDVVNQSSPSDVVNQSSPSDVVNQSSPSDVVNQSSPSDVINQSSPSDAINQSSPSDATSSSAEPSLSEGSGPSVEYYSTHRAGHRHP